MKKKIVCLLTALLLISSMVAIADGTPTAYNFDDGTANGWTAVGNASSHTATATGREGTGYAYQMTGDGQEELYIWRTITVQQNLTYEINGYIKTENCTGTGAKITVKRTNLTDYTIGESPFFTGTNDWTYFSVCVATKMSIWNDVAVIKLSLTGAGTVYFDDITITQRASYVVNGSFEATSGDWSTASTRTTDFAKTGSYALQIVNDAKPYVRLSNVQEGQHYKVSFWFRHNGATGNEGVAPNPSFQHMYTLNNTTTWGECKYFMQYFNYPYTKDWRQYTIYYTVPTLPEGASSSYLLLYLQGRAGYTSYYDDFTFEQVDDTVSYTVGSTPVTAVTSGNVKISVQHVSQDYKNAKAVRMMGGVYRVENNVKTLVSFGEIASGTPATSLATYKFVTGDVPLPLETTVEVPADLTDGDYIIKTFLWYDLGNLTPVGEAFILAE